MPARSARRAPRRTAAGRTARSRERAAGWSFLALDVAEVAVVVAPIAAGLGVGVVQCLHRLRLLVVGRDLRLVGLDLLVALVDLRVVGADGVLAGAVERRRLLAQHVAAAIDRGLRGGDIGLGLHGGIGRLVPARLLVEAIAQLLRREDRIGALLG